MISVKIVKYKIINGVCHIDLLQLAKY